MSNDPSMILRVALPICIAATMYGSALGHDGINRLVTAEGSWGSGSMGYDGAGNLTLYSLNNTHRVNTYDPGTNRLTNTQFETAGVVNSRTSYAYDAYGNASPTSDSYTYDNASNLIAPGAGRTNAYDGANSRVKTVAGGVTTYEFRSAHGLLLAEWRKQSGYYDILKEHMHIAGKEVAEQRTNFLGSDIQPVTWQFLHNDANGSAVAATWAGGGLLFKENYQPYGSQINSTAGGYTQRAFAGHKQDKPDLIYMGARYYNPMVGRFLSIDPKEADPSDLHSLNRYAYANNNPYRYVDPDGYNPVDLIFAAVDAVRLGVAIYKGGDVGGAALDLGISAAAVFSPVPFVGEAAKARYLTKAAEAAGEADKVVGAFRAVARGGETEAAAVGRRAHGNYGTALGEKFDTKVTLPSGKKPDAVNWESREVRELKPDNARAVRRGERQVEGYRQELEKTTGEKWTSEVDTYRSKGTQAGE